MAALAQPLPVRVVQLGRERPFANPRRIGFHDPKHIINRRWAKTHARRRLPCNHIRRGYKRISAKIDIQQRTLRPFKQDPLARFALFAKDLPNRSGKRQDFWRNLLQLRQ